MFVTVSGPGFVIWQHYMNRAFSALLLVYHGCSSIFLNHRLVPKLYHDLPSVFGDVAMNFSCFISGGQFDPGGKGFDS